MPFKPFVPEGVKPVERRDMVTAEVNPDAHKPNRHIIGDGLKDYGYQRSRPVELSGMKLYGGHQRVKPASRISSIVARHLMSQYNQSIPYAQRPYRDDGLSHKRLPTRTPQKGEPDLRGPVNPSTRNDSFGAVGV